jgi:hypothetical protein
MKTSSDREIRVEARLFNENIWLNQKTMAKLFQVDLSTINEHLKNIYTTGELDERATFGKFPIVQTEGERQLKIPSYRKNKKADYR